MPSDLKKSGMSGRDKGMITFAVVAVLLAVLVIYRTIQSQQPVVTREITGVTGMAPKLQAMKRMQSSPGSLGAQPPAAAQPTAGQ
jgi:hypothetical protein